MILTCPRCATRYLADPLLVWATGRTVQCAACGQRWRAVGEGARPAREPEPAAEPPPRDEIEPAAAAAAAPHAPRDAPRVDEAPPPRPPELVEAGPLTPALRRAAASDRHASAPPPTPTPTPATDAALKVSLFRPPPRLTSSFASGPSRAGRWLAIAILLMIAVAAFVMFRDVIVTALPGLAPIYAAMGLLVHPAASPHG